MLRQALAALEFLHSKEKIHGGIRPTNLLVSATGRVKLSDLAQGDPTQEVRLPSGDQKYLAPELLQPKFGAVSPATDLYVLGMLALEMLVGPKLADKLPGIASGSGDLTLAWMRWQTDPAPYPAVQTLGKNYPSDLCEVLDSMLAKHVPDRVDSAAKALQGLSQQQIVLMPSELSSRPIEATVDPTFVRELAPVPTSDFTPMAEQGGDGLESPATTLRPDTKTKKKANPRDVVLAAASVLLLMLVLGVVFVTRSGETEVAELPPEPQPVEENREEPAPVPEPEEPVPVEPQRVAPEIELPEITIPAPPIPRFTIPAGFEAVPETEFDEASELPVRIRSIRFPDAEFALVRVGVYSVGVGPAQRLAWERPADKFENAQPYYFALTETPVGHYEQFAAEMGEDAAGQRWFLPNRTWRESLDGEVDAKQLPVTMVSQDNARNYAEWLGANLPSENQWEAGARVVQAERAAQVRTFTGDELAPVTVNAAGYASLETEGAHVLGNVAEWTKGAEPIVRGAGYATPHGDHVRIGWRSKADLNGQWDVGIRLIVNVIDGEEPAAAEDTLSAEPAILFANYHHQTDRALRQR